MNVSVVIPVLEDLPSLARLIDQLRLAAPAQIIVVDGNASAACRDLCAAAGCDYLAAAPNRGSQLDAGARSALGDVLWFLHADSVPPANGLEDIENHIAAGHVGGYFNFAFAGERGWHKHALEWLINARARIGIPYGDQGLFVSAAVYRASAGFAPSPLFEEVRLVRSLRRLGRFGSVNASIGVSPRRWERDGWVRRTVSNRLLAIAYGLGVSPERLARHYRSTGN